MSKEKEGIDIGTYINRALTLAFIILVGYMLFNGGVVRERFAVVEHCGGNNILITEIESQEQLDLYMQRVITGNTRKGEALNLSEIDFDSITAD